MRVVALILSVLGVLYGALLIAKPHLAIRRSQATSPKALWIARVKGILALILGVMLWRYQGQ